VIISNLNPISHRLATVALLRYWRQTYKQRTMDRPQICH